MYKFGRLLIHKFSLSVSSQLTYEAPFLTMEKIKVVGSTYMAACGLQPGRRYSDDSNFEERDKQENVATITKFAAAMFEKLKAMNREHLQDFRLRVGESGGWGRRRVREDIGTCKKLEICGSKAFWVMVTVIMLMVMSVIMMMKIVRMMMVMIMITIWRMPIITIIY